VGKRPSFIEEATSRLSFLVDDQGFAGPETTEWPATARIAAYSLG
jgi:hypothetical protein